MVFSRCSTSIALLVACAGASQLLTREYEEALVSDDVCVSSDCALRLLQLRTAAVRQPVEQTLEEKIKDAMRAEAEPTAIPEEQARPALISLPGQERELPWMVADDHADVAAQGSQEVQPQQAQEKGDELPVFVDAGTEEVGGDATGEATVVSKDASVDESPVSATAEELPFWAQLSRAAEPSPEALVAPVMSAPVQQAADTSSVSAASAVPMPPLALVGASEPAIVRAESSAAAEIVKVAPVSATDSAHASAPGSGYDHPTWLQNCTKILLDLGSGSGEHVRMMYEPETFTKSNVVLVIQQIFGNPIQRQLPGNESGICVLGFEPDPKYTASLEELREKYSARGWNVHFYPFASWSSDGVMSLPRVLGAEGASESDGAAEVRTVDIADFASSLPPAFGVRMMIMDMDGAEYESLAQLLETTMLCQSIVKGLLVSASQHGDVTRWADPALSKFGGRSISDIKKRVSVQHCKAGRTTPVMNLDKYAVPLPR